MVDHSGTDVENRHGYAAGSGQPQPDKRIVQRKGLQSLLGIIIVAGSLVLVDNVEAGPDHGHAGHLAFAQHTAILQIAQGLFDGEIGENVGVKRNPAIAEQPRPPVENCRRVGNCIRPIHIRLNHIQLGKAPGFLGALRQGPHLLNDSQDIVVDENTCLAGSARINSLASQKTIQKNETLVVAWTPQSRNQVIHPGPQDPRPRSLSEGVDLDPRLLREGGPV